MKNRLVHRCRADEQDENDGVGNNGDDMAPEMNVGWLCPRLSSPPSTL